MLPGVEDQDRGRSLAGIALVVVDLSKKIASILDRADRDTTDPRPSRGPGVRWAAGVPCQAVARAARRWRV
ncbi:hypothetical protein GCM10020367_22970 [Streptomyces sannanensis]|uniref:Uncharacterized protein n=1 Tax=Streptomyces sannanensis TaxID=285536 RepID=A0ABP6SAT7_9ACTN